MQWFNSQCNCRPPINLLSLLLLAVLLLLLLLLPISQKYARLKTFLCPATCTGDRAAAGGSQ